MVWSGVMWDNNNNICLKSNIQTSSVDKVQYPNEFSGWGGMVLCGMMWCGMVLCGMVWCSVMWAGVVWCGVVNSFGYWTLNKYYYYY